MKVTILGHYIGTAEGWDEGSEFGVFYYDVDSTNPHLNESSFHFDAEKGTFEWYDDTGELVKSMGYKEVLG